MPFIRPGYLDAPRPACPSVNVRAAVFPCLIHKRYYACGLELRHHPGIDRPHLATVSDNVNATYNGRFFFLGKCNPIRDASYLRQLACDLSQLLSRRVFAGARKSVYGPARHRGQHWRYGVGAARGLGKDGKPGEVQAASLYGRAHEPDQAPRVQPGQFGDTHMATDDRSNLAARGPVGFRVARETSA